MITEALLLAGGILAGAVLVWPLLLRTKRECTRLDEEKQLLEQEKKSVDDFMHNLVGAIGEGVERGELFRRIAHTAVHSIGAMSACVYERVERGRLRGVAVEGLFPPQRRQLESPEEGHATRARFLENVLRSEVLEPGEGVVGEVARTGKPVIIQDAVNDPRIVHHADPALALRSIIYSPMQFGDQMIGVLAVANPSNGLPFTENEFSLVNSLAEQASLAVRNSDVMNLRIEKNRLEMDLSLASNVQALFLTENYPASKELDVDARYIPSAQVGGDFYDFHKIGRSRYAVAIADVSGKGVPASLLMAICQTNLRHFVKRAKSPAEVLVKLNQDLNERMRRDMFITLFLGFIDTDKSTLIYSRAGHEPGLLLRASTKGDPEVEALRGDGMALGMVPNELFEEITIDQTCSFNQGDALVLFTDGITETINGENEEYSLVRLVAQLKKLGEKSMNAFNEELLRDLGMFAAETNERDDVTLISVRRN